RRPGGGADLQDRRAGGRSARHAGGRRPAARGAAGGAGALPLAARSEPRPGGPPALAAHPPPRPARRLDWRGDPARRGGAAGGEHHPLAGAPGAAPPGRPRRLGWGEGGCQREISSGAMIRVFTDPTCLNHRAPSGYPECPERLSGVLAHLRERGWPVVETAADVSEEARSAVAALHGPEYVARFERAAARGVRLPDPPANRLSAGTWGAAWGAVGATLAAADWVAAGDRGGGRTALAAGGPPGPHAGRGGGL